jgi:hypothetical protein
VVTAGAGVSGQIVRGAAATTIGTARETTVQGLAPTPDAETKYRAGALAVTALAPGVAPWVSGRVGIGWQSEAGITYTGRALRVDARRAFGDESFAVSVGAGAHAMRGRPGSGPSADLSGLGTEGVSGAGLDVPVIAGWRSAAGLVQVWGGGRFFYEHLGGSICLHGPCGLGGASDGNPWSGTHISAGGLAGLALGFRHVFVAIEVDVAYEHANAAFDGGGDLSVSGLSVAPAGALIGRF